MPSGDQPWWQRAVLYQVYVRSFADSDGDGVGDLRGITQRLEYLHWLGVDALWLSPVTVSPDKDWGYDVADYEDVQPVFGGMPAFDELVAQANARGIEVIVDLVPNHSSDAHPWFQESRASRESPLRDWYVWADPKPDGSPPNNWRSTFGAGVPAWTLDARTGQYYLHNFLPEQPDLNWWNDDVRAAFDDIIRFWLDRGVAGFRIDVAHGIVKDRDLRDNPDPAVSTYNANRDDVHEVFRRWRRLTDTYEPERILLGETWVDLDRLASFYGADNDELHLAFNFPFTFSPLEAAALRGVVEQSEAGLPPQAWPVWMLSNHDIVRFPTRMAGGDEHKARAALFLLLTLRGTPVLYYGDELGMPQADVTEERERDMAGRDGARTPMPWNGGWNDPWLPQSADVEPVATQRENDASFLNFCRNLIARRRASQDLLAGAYETLPAPDGVWAFRRGERTRVAVNLTDDAVELDGRRLEAWEGRIDEA